jgi:type VI secretion system secreted protein Hcp
MKSLRLLSCAIAIFMAAGLTPAHAVGELFLKIDNLLGESEEPGHVGEIEVLSFSFGASQTGIREAGGRASARRSSLSPIVFVKKVDKASPKLFLACAMGSHIKDAVLTVRTGDDKRHEYLVITLSDVLISSYQLGAVDDGGLATESISFSYSKIEYKYIGRNAAGQPLQPVVVSFDVLKNKELPLAQ